MGSFCPEARLKWVQKIHFLQETLELREYHMLPFPRMEHLKQVCSCSTHWGPRKASLPVASPLSGVGSTSSCKLGVITTAPIQTPSSTLADFNSYAGKESSTELTDPGLHLQQKCYVFSVVKHLHLVFSMCKQYHKNVSFLNVAILKILDR